MYKKNKKKAFTLIELLVVIAIIALLIAVLIPALSKAKRLVMQIKCGNQVRQHVWSLSMYAGDNNDYLPNIKHGWWLWDLPFAVTDVLLKYTGETRKLFYCPANKWISAKRTGLWYFTLGVGEFEAEESAQAKDDAVTGGARERNYRVTGYTWVIAREGAAEIKWDPIIKLDPDNWYNVEKLGSWPKRLNMQEREKRNPAEVALVCDMVISNSYYGPDPRDPHRAVFRSPGSNPNNWHSPSNHMIGDKATGGNVGFLDNHVDWRKLSKMIYRNETGDPVFWW